MRWCGKMTDETELLMDLVWEWVHLRDMSQSDHKDAVKKTEKSCLTKGKPKKQFFFVSRTTRYKRKWKHTLEIK